MTCRYAHLVSTAARLAAAEHLVEVPEPCDETSAYVVTIATEDDGYVVEIRAPLCAVHEAHASFNPRYVRSVGVHHQTT